jgi:RHS repeat-associated protein
MNVEYDPLYRTVQRATTWQREQADVPTASSAWIRFAYDVHGRLAGVWAADNTTGSPDTVYEYNNGAPVSTRRTIVFDAESRGRLHDRTECLDGMGRSVGEVVVVAPGLYRHINRQVYNVAGQSAWQWKPWTDASPACDVAPPPSVIRTTLTRDALQRLVRTEIDDSAEYGSPSVSRTVYAPLAQTEYDFSDMDSASPHADTPTTTLVDGLGRMTGVVERSRPTDARQHEFHYDERGGLAGWTTATGAQRRQLRDVRGQVVEVRDANHGTTRWQYDLLGNVAQVTEPTGEVITTVRDALSRPVTVLVDGTVRDEYRYDQVLGENGQRVYGEGRLSWAGYTLVNGVWSQEGVDRFVHDVRGQLAMVERTVDGVTHRLGMTYDNNGRVVQETVDGVAMPRVTLDAFGEFDGLAGVVTGVERDTHGNVNRLTYASGVVESMDFTTRNEVERTHVTGPEGAVLLSVSAQRDRMGNVLGIVDHSPLGPQARHDATFAYDGLSRMTAMTLSPSTTTRIAATYAYDGEGNLTRVQSGGVSVGPHEGTYVYDGVARQRLQRVNQPDGEVVWRSYDEAGRVLVEGERQFEWLAGGRLGLARRGEFEVGFDYDAGGEQVYWRDTALGSGVQLAPHIAVRDGLVQYTVEAGRPIAELTFASSAVRDRCAYGGAGLAGARQAYLALSAPDRAARGRLADCLRQAAAEASLETGSISWTGVHVGVLSGVPLLTDEQGRAVTERVHTPHGFELANAGVREQFMGIEGARVHDASLHSLGVRTYSVDTAQWLSPDPLTAVVEADATNLWETLFYPYRYANQNPATLSDESGELPFIVVGAAVGAVIAGGLELGKQMASGKELRWGDIGQKAFWGGVGGVLGGLGATTYAGVILGQVGGAIAEEAAEMLIPEAGCPPGVSACFVAKSVIGAAGGALGSGLGDLASAAASSAGRAGLAMLAALPAETGVRALASFGADVAKGTVEDLVKKSVLEPVGNAIGRAAAQAASTAYSAAESGYQRLEQSIQQTVTAPNIYMSPGAGVLP